MFHSARFYVETTLLSINAVPIFILTVFLYNKQAYDYYLQPSRIMRYACGSPHALSIYFYACLNGCLVF